MRKITPIMLILIASFILLSSFSFAFNINQYDWDMSQHNIFNDVFHPLAVGTNQFDNVKNLSVTSDANMPISVDINSDGVDDLVLSNAGLINTYLLHINSTGGRIPEGALISDQEPNNNMISMIYSFISSTADPYIRIIGYNSTHVLMWNVAPSGAITFNNAVAFPVNFSVVDYPSNYIMKSSVNCLAAANPSNTSLTYCSFKGVNNTILVFNFNSSSFSSTGITETRYALANLYDYGFDYKAPIYVNVLSNQTDGYPIYLCNASGRYGVMGINMTSGATIYANCTLNADPAIGSPKLYVIPGNLGYDILFQSQHISTGYYNKIFAYNPLSRVLETNYPILDPDTGQNRYSMGFGYNNNFLYLCTGAGIGGNIGIGKWDISQVSPKLVYQFYASRSGYSTGAIGDAVIVGGDYAYCGGVFYSELFNQTQIPDSRGSASPCWLAMTFGNIISSDPLQNNFHGAELCTDNQIHLYHAIAIPPPSLTYANVSVCFQDSKYKQPLQNVYFNITRNSVIFSQYNTNYFNPDTGCYPSVVTGADNPPFTRSANISASVFGYPDLKTSLNLSVNGTYTIYLNFTTPTNGSLSLPFDVLDYNSANTIPNVIYSLVAVNGTAPYNVQVNNVTDINGGAIVSGLVPDNYTIYLSALNYPPQSFTFTLSSSAAKSFYLTQQVIAPQKNPVIVRFNYFTLTDAVDANGFRSTIVNLNPTSICQNQTVILNITTRAVDSYTYSIYGFSNINNITGTQALANARSGTTMNFSKNSINQNFYVFLSPFNTTQTNITFGAYITSNLLNYQPSQINTLLANNLAISQNVLIGSCSQEQSAAVVPSTSQDFGLGLGFSSLFAGLGFKDSNTKSILGIVLWMVIVVGGAATVAKKVGEGGNSNVASIFGVTAGILGIGVSVLFSLVIPLLPAYFVVLFSLVSAAAIALSVKGAMQG